MACPEKRDGSGVAGDFAGVTVEVERPGMRVVTARGEMDALTCPAWRETLVDQLAREDCGVLLVDLGEVGFAGASVLNILVQTRATAQRDSVDLRLVAGPWVTHLLDLAGLGQLFAVYADRPEAVAAAPGVRGQFDGDR